MPPSLSGLPAQICVGTDVTLLAKAYGYCHIGSQRGRVPKYVRTGRPNNEGGVGGRDPAE